MKFEGFVQEKDWKEELWHILTSGLELNFECEISYDDFLEKYYNPDFYRSSVSFILPKNKKKADFLYDYLLDLEDIFDYWFFWNEDNNSIDITIFYTILIDCFSLLLIKGIDKNLLKDLREQCIWDVSEFFYIIKNEKIPEEEAMYQYAGINHLGSHYGYWEVLDLAIKIGYIRKQSDYFSNWLWNRLGDDVLENSTESRKKRLRDLTKNIHLKRIMPERSTAKFEYVIYCSAYLLMDLYLVYDGSNYFDLGKIIEKSSLDDYLSKWCIILDVSSIIRQNFKELFKKDPDARKNLWKYEEKKKKRQLLLKDMIQSSQKTKILNFSVNIKDEIPQFMSWLLETNDINKYKELEDFVWEYWEIIKVKNGGRSTALKAKKHFKYRSWKEEVE